MNSPKAKPTVSDGAVKSFMLHGRKTRCTHCGTDLTKLDMTKLIDHDMAEQKKYGRISS